MCDHTTTNISTQPMRKGWTVIELIFIIIIIGILAALAIPKLAATRDDAKLSITVHNMGVCINDIGSHYAATGKDYNETDHPASCDVKNTECYHIDYLGNGEINVTTLPNIETFCSDIDNVGEHLAQHYQFGGTRIE